MVTKASNGLILLILILMLVTLLLMIMLLTSLLLVVSQIPGNDANTSANVTNVATVTNISPSAVGNIPANVTKIPATGLELL